jgi:hypothetical protein
MRTFAFLLLSLLAVGPVMTRTGGRAGVRRGVDQGQ